MIHIEAKLTSYNSLKTRQNLTFSTRAEIDDLVLSQMMQSEGHLLFSVDELKARVEAVMKDKKIGINESGFSPSQILRGTLSKIWEDTSIEISFDDFYKAEMSKIIKHYKSKLNG
jgi:hypothetical protein